MDRGDRQRVKNGNKQEKVKHKEDINGNVIDDGKKKNKKKKKHPRKRNSFLRRG